MFRQIRNSTPVLLAAIVLGATLTAKGGTSTSSSSDLTMRIPDEMGPPGGVVQMTVLTTEVSPISGGRPAFRTAGDFEVAGISVFNAAGEAAGAAIVDGDGVQMSYVTTAPFTGEYPVMAVSLRIHDDVPVGTTSDFTLDPGSLWNFGASGPVTARISPGTITVGGTVSITDVFPAEGMAPAGTVVSVRGMGFSSSTQVRVGAPTGKAVTVVSPNELQFTLTAPTNLTGLRIRAINPDNSRSEYFAYMRGIEKTSSSRGLLAATRPIFSLTSRSAATLGPIPALDAGQYSAIALQNPNGDAVALTLSLYAADGTLIHQAANTIDSRERRSLEVSEWLDGVAPPAGSSVVVSASAPIDAISLLCDEGRWTVAPSLPVEARQ